MDAEVPFLLSDGAGTDEMPLAGVSDYRGRPVYRDTSGGWRSALFVSGAYKYSSIHCPPAYYVDRLELISSCVNVMNQTSA